jgi:hypothetical protein
MPRQPVPALRIGCGLPLSIGVEQLALFSEPELFLDYPARGEHAGAL